MVLTAVTRLLAVVTPLALGLVVLLPSPSWAALNAYLKLSDCDGTVTAGGISGLIQLNGFTSKVANTASPVSGGGSGAGKAEASPIQVLKDLDKCSPHLFLDVVTGKHLPTVTILFTRATRAGKEQPFFKIVLKDVTISAVEATTVAKTGTEDLRNIQESTAPEVNTGDPAAVQEVVTLTFRRIELTDVSTNTTVTFDFAENRT